MPHEKHSSHPTFLDTFCENYSKSNQVGYNVLNTLKFQKSKSAYKKHQHRQHQTRELISFFTNKNHKGQQNILNSRLLTQNTQGKKLPNKKKDKLAFYQEKYNQQISSLSSNLCIRQIENQKSFQRKNERKSSCQTLHNQIKNSILQSKDFVLKNKFSPYRTHKRSIINIDQNYDLFKETNFKNKNKLRFNTRLKPLNQVKNTDFNVKKIGELYFPQKQEQKGLGQKQYFSDTRVANAKKIKRIIMDQLYAKQDINPWQNNNSFVDHENLFMDHSSLFNPNLDSDTLN